MSIDVMNAVWRSTLEGANKRFVLLALADRADDDGWCWPGVQNLVDKTGLSESTVKRVCRELQTDDLLAVKPRYTRSGDRDTNGYRINLDLLDGMRRPRSAERGRGGHPMETGGDVPPLPEKTAGHDGVGSHSTHPAGWVHTAPTPGQADPTRGHREPTGGATVTPNTSGDPSEEIPLTPLPRGAGSAGDDGQLSRPDRCDSCGRLACRLRACGNSPRQQTLARRAEEMAIVATERVQGQVQARGAREMAREQAATAGLDARRAIRETLARKGSGRAG